MSMIVEPRISIITLGVAEMNRSVCFYKDGLGWPTTADDHADWAIFHTIGTRFALYPRLKLARDIGPDIEPNRPGFCGITLAHNVRNKAGVEAVLAAAAHAGGRILKHARNAEWEGTAAILEIRTATLGKSPGAKAGCLPWMERFGEDRSACRAP